ncbi:MAG: hypothetical protein RL367_1790, partial [Pseudomonadota bacterium]
AAGNGPALRHPDFGFGGFVRAPRQKPWIAAVTGFAMGGGLEFALACDMIIAGTSAQFGLPESLRGILAGAGGMFRLPRVIPRPIAVEMMTSGKRLGAARAFELGLVNEVVADDQIMAAALALAERVAAAAPLAVQESLTMIRAAADHDEAVLWDMSLAASARVSASEDAKEGPRAFKEKRPPVWTGR